MDSQHPGLQGRQKIPEQLTHTLDTTLLGLQLNKWEDAFIEAGSGPQAHPIPMTGPQASFLLGTGNCPQPAEVSGPPKPDKVTRAQLGTAARGGLLESRHGPPRAYNTLKLEGLARTRPVL